MPGPVRRQHDVHPAVPIQIAYGHLRFIRPARRDEVSLPGNDGRFAGILVPAPAPDDIQVLIGIQVGNAGAPLAVRAFRDLLEPPGVGLRIGWTRQVP